jgi:hypothetical protein
LPFRQREAQIYRFGNLPVNKGALRTQALSKLPIQSNEKKYTKGYITWHKWQEELKENGKREELVLNEKNRNC